MHIASVVDQPREGDFHYRQRIPVNGWVHAGYRHDKIKRISVHAPQGEIGSTTLLYPRADVALAHQLAPDVRTGFRLLAVFEPGGPPPAVLGLEVRVEFTDGTVTPLAGIHIQILPNDHTGAPYGNLCNPRQTEVLHREHLYATGHPAEQASPDCVNLIAEYLPAGISLLDVGCGVGAYCEPLRARGFSWIGCETSLACVHELALRSRPHRVIPTSPWPWSRYRLPAADREFDATLAIEVLEHVAEPEAFLAEMARVTRRQAIFSVPNLEPLPFLSNRLVAPWHMLEGDHRNFFTRFNLCPLLQRHFRHVEVLDYGPQPLASTDGQPLPYHLFAICEV
jgi:SAM-dependent methyltransferase